MWCRARAVQEGRLWNNVDRHCHSCVIVCISPQLVVFALRGNEKAPPFEQPRARGIQRRRGLEQMTAEADVHERGSGVTCYVNHHRPTRIETWTFCRPAGAGVYCLEVLGCGGVVTCRARAIRRSNRSMPHPHMARGQLLCL